MKIRKPSLKPKTGKNRSIDGVQSSLYNPLGDDFPPTTFIEQFQKEMVLNCTETQFSKLFNLPSEIATTECQFGPVPKGSPLSYQQKVVPDYSNITKLPQSEDFPPLPLTILSLQTYSKVLTRKEAIYFEGHQLSLQECHAIEEQTRDQSKSPYWEKLRKTRITASIFKRVAARKKDYESLIGQLKKKVRQTEAMKYGLEHEGEAAIIYSDSKAVNVRRTGFVVNPGCPQLGASPDYIVYDPANSDNVFGCLEIKCLQASFVTDAKCLKTHNGQLSLRKTHQYYYQIQGQLGITGLKWCDLMVLCKDDWHIERIHFNEDFFLSMCCNLDKFFFEYFLPLLVV